MYGRATTTTRVGGGGACAMTFQHSDTLFLAAKSAFSYRDDAPVIAWMTQRSLRRYNEMVHPFSSLSPIGPERILLFKTPPTTTTNAPPRARDVARACVVSAVATDSAPTYVSQMCVYVVAYAILAPGLLQHIWADTSATRHRIATTLRALFLRRGYRCQITCKTGGVSLSILVDLGGVTRPIVIRPGNCNW